ncbi:unnamed protein product [Bathycoccus prasinos]
MRSRCSCRCLCSSSISASSVLPRRRRTRRTNCEERQQNHAERKLKKNDATRRRTAVLVSSSTNHHESSSEFDVYIEDTDHYAVVYYANYFRFCARAFEIMLLEMRNDDATTLTTTEDLGEERGEFYDDDDEFGAWWCDHIEEAKYVSPAILGDRIRVESIVIAENISDDEREKSWVVNHSMRKMGGDDDDDDEDATTVSFTCRLRYRSRRGGRKSSNWYRESSDSASSSGSGSSSSRSETDRRRATNIRFFASELNHRSVWHVDVLRWFERNRTDLIGGPKALESLKSEDECVVVVSSISNVTIFTDVIEDMIVQSSRGAHPSSLLSFSSVRFLRRDVQCEFDQRVVGLADAPNDDLRVVASGKITCTVLKRENMRPRKSPQALKERLLVA